MYFNLRASPEMTELAAECKPQVVDEATHRDRVAALIMGSHDRIKEVWAGRVPAGAGGAVVLDECSGDAWDACFLPAAQLRAQYPIVTEAVDKDLAEGRMPVVVRFLQTLKIVLPCSLPAPAPLSTDVKDTSSVVPKG